MKIEQGTESPRQGNAKNDPRRCGCGKPHDGRNVQYQRKPSRKKTIQPPQGWAGKRLCEHIGAEIERHAAKGAEKKALDATQPKTHSSACSFPKRNGQRRNFKKRSRNRIRRADCLDAARAAIPKQTKIKKERVFDEAKGKAKTRLSLKRRISPQTASCGITPYPVRHRINSTVHGKIYEVEKENVGVESGHRVRTCRRESGRHGGAGS